MGFSFKKSKVKSVLSLTPLSCKHRQVLVYKVPMGLKGGWSPTVKARSRLLYCKVTPSAGLTQGSSAFVLMQSRPGPGSGKIDSEFSFGIGRSGQGQAGCKLDK